MSRKNFDKKEYCIYTDITVFKDKKPVTERNYFRGVHHIKMAGEGGRLIDFYSNVWEPDRTFLREDTGIWTYKECERYLPIIGEPLRMLHIEKY